MNKEDLGQLLQEIQAQADQLFTFFDVKSLEEKQAEFRIEMNNPNFWNDPEIATEVSQKAARLDKQLTQLTELKHIAELSELLEIAEESDMAEIESEAMALKTTIETMETNRLFDGEYDDKNVLLSIKVGNGGQDAEDFAEMLLRMYTRWGEQQDAKVELIEISKSDVGLKSATLGIKAEYAYGKLRGEHGVHRLIRMSPFNAKGLRQTSFARVEILPDIGETADIQLEPSDLRIDVFRSSGAGGQSVNTTDSAVRITYLPLNVVVTCQNEKSQLQNKESAMRVLRARLLQLKLEQQAEELSELRGEMLENSFGSQIRTYTLQPYKLVKDHRTDYEETQPDKVFDGNLDGFTKSFLSQ